MMIGATLPIDRRNRSRSGLRRMCVDAPSVCTSMTKDECSSLLAKWRSPGESPPSEGKSPPAEQNLLPPKQNLLLQSNNLLPPKENLLLQRTLMLFERRFLLLQRTSRLHGKQKMLCKSKICFDRSVRTLTRKENMLRMRHFFLLQSSFLLCCCQNCFIRRR
jgi:hypothetical protein